jgi:hypothetical protein
MLVEKKMRWPLGGNFELPTWFITMFRQPDFLIAWWYWRSLLENAIDGNTIVRGNFILCTQPDLSSERKRHMH